MRYLALACDYDGTLASDGQVSDAALTALQHFRASGRKVILVTGRQLRSSFRSFRIWICASGLSRRMGRSSINQAPMRKRD